MPGIAVRSCRTESLSGTQPESGCMFIPCMSALIESIIWEVSAWCTGNKEVICAGVMAPRESSCALIMAITCVPCMVICVPPIIPAAPAAGVQAALSAGGLRIVTDRPGGTS